MTAIELGTIIGFLLRLVWMFVVGWAALIIIGFI
jgi:hypothetical protein